MANVATVKKTEPVAPIFETAHQALTFAYLHAINAAPKILTPVGDARPIGRGLGGLDGAAQAGMIRAEVRALSGIGRHIIAARFAPHSIPCECRAPCCAGHKPNPEWSEAISEITASVIPQALVGCIINRRLVGGIVKRFFGEKIGIGELADYCEVNRDTAGMHNARVFKALKPADSLAWRDIEERLRIAGIV